ncbi:uncharacterized protein SOCE26_036860 [Sorangium cellulosum]|uniref:Tyr recombinase domain-containing protein n=1 Tax=Sorangium cellulosum TaxID=56 RepID=A0A2L0ESH0_SORCE|nr:uncharacterized protein SOCE26_036860 [Sorangium cellulosum]
MSSLTIFESASVPPLAQPPSHLRQLARRRLWARRWTLEEVGEHLGHTSIASTHRYAHLSETAIKGAVHQTPGCPGGRRCCPHLPRFRVRFHL